ncbi:protein shuttle craft [Achroia grisella]|uniref:protein shuttle craft n=1 Tax=Achroia grisella TaxID=688607 RepID=UPI0027D1F55B|nr:protein shuttle craft [Achroia grisella]
MSQWNNSYVYNNQYQGANSWNGDLNDQYTNRTYYPNVQQDATNHYVSFNEFLSQMQGNSIPTTNNTSFNNPQYQTYEQYNYPNIPSTSHNIQPDRYYGANASNQGNSFNQNQHNTQLAQPEPNVYTNEMILNSNLTPTAVEFVPKSSSVKPSTSAQSIPEASQSSSNECVTENKKYYNRSSADTNWRERSKPAQNNGDSNHRNELVNRQDNYRNNDSRYRNRNYHDQGGRYESGSQESGNRNNDRNQSKSNSKIKNKDSDPGRTFYNSTINKNGQEVRNGKEGPSGRGRNWAGSQRVRTAERNPTEDEQYANNYLHYKDEKSEKQNQILKTENTYSPLKIKSKNSEQVHSEMTQRERLSEQLDKGTLECLVCCERVKQTDPVWSCNNCYHVLHLRCIRKWAVSSMVEAKWRCPACQNTSKDIPTEYRCMCGAVRSPEYQRGSSGAHTCGKSCKRPRNCPHPCTLLCHPGPCPPCQATIRKECGCGAETRSVLCSSKLPQLCERTCSRTLACTKHACTQQCHEGPCNPCTKTVTQVCHCPAAETREAACSDAAWEGARAAAWACGGACGRVLACGAHVCSRACHAPPCAPCALRPGNVPTCPCGKNKLEENKRKTCTDPIPLCGNICAKPLACGPAGDKHFCKIDCHDGPCPVCPDKTLLQCRCGHSSREVPCSDLPEMYNNVLCQKKCNKKLSCGRHRCRAACCAATAHRCSVVCGRSLACQLHRCEESCHTGHCAPCPRLSFEELRCACGSQVSLPPVRCGARPPACSAPCGRARACGHEPLHSCHSGDCPPCVVLTTKRCHGGHEVRTYLLYQTWRPPACSAPCGRARACGHEPLHSCHSGDCPPCVVLTTKRCHGGHEVRTYLLYQTWRPPACSAPCGRTRACGHEPLHSCHSGDCPPCVVLTTKRCHGGHEVRTYLLYQTWRPPACSAPCGRARACGHEPLHSCHSGDCPPCVVLTTKRCHGGHEVRTYLLYQTGRPPACSAPCGRARACGHEPLHSCHSGDCPPCVVLTTKRCHGGHEERKTIPCSQEEFSCGLPCGKPLPCGKHTCIQTCHKGPCDTVKCTQPCAEARGSCGHECAAPCHAAAGSTCPSGAPCRRAVQACCPCGRRRATRACADNARDHARIMSALAAAKIQEGGSVDISSVQRPSSMLKTLECDDECRVEARTRQMALALQIRNPDVSAKLAPRYSDMLRATAAREPAFAQQVHDRLTDLVHLAKKSKQKTRSHSFPSMNWQKRQFIHELCEHFGCESVAYDAEPNRNVVATADKEKSWLPAMSVLEVVSREAGKRRVPGPVLRAPPPAATSASASAAASAGPAATSKSSTGWATLTSANAWAARSQTKPVSEQPKPKIDYFDNPPEN